MLSDNKSIVENFGYRVHFAKPNYIFPQISFLKDDLFFSKIKMLALRNYKCHI